MSEVFESTDLDSSEALLRAQYTAVRMSALGDRHLVRIAQHQVGRCRLDRMTVVAAVDVEADPLGAIVVGRVNSGRGTYQERGGRERRYRDGDVYVSAHPDVGFRATVSDFGVDIAVLDPAVLGQVADPRPRSGDTVRLLDHDPVSASAAALWWHTYSFVLTSRQVPAPASPIFEREATRLLVAATLTAFPSNAATEPTIEDRHDAHPQTLGRATAFIEANAWHDISIREIADAAGVTIRSVQLSFRRHLDTTPMAYVRRVRLQYVRDELVDGDPDSTTVTGVAGRWGFSNFGRFAAQYRVEFGELPGQTLRR